MVSTTRMHQMRAASAGRGAAQGFPVASSHAPVPGFRWSFNCFVQRPLPSRTTQTVAWFGFPQASHASPARARIRARVASHAAPR